MKSAKYNSRRSSTGKKIIGTVAMTALIAGGVAIATALNPLDAEARQANSAQNITFETVTGGTVISDTLPAGNKISITTPQTLLNTSTFKPSSSIKTMVGYLSDTTYFPMANTTPAGAPAAYIAAMSGPMNRFAPYNNDDVSYTIPTSIINNNKYYDTMKFTVTFDPPIADPRLNIAASAWTVGNDWENQPIGKLTMTNVTDQKGSKASASLTKLSGMSAYTVSGTTIAPTKAPCNRPAAAVGTVKVNTNGKAVSSITFQAADSVYGKAAVTKSPKGLCGKKDGKTYGTTVYLSNWGFQLNAPEAVSMLDRTKAASFGSASHVITDQNVRMGLSVGEGNKNTYSLTANPGTALDNSDGSMKAISGRSFPVAYPGDTYTISNIPVSNTSTKTLAVQGWIDFNSNNAFDADEASTVATVAPGQTTVSLTWTVPSQVKNANVSMRLRLGPADEITGKPTGMATMGEVEDYANVIPTCPNGLKPAFTVTKKADKTTAEENDTVTYTITAKNTGLGTATSVTVTDPKISSLSCTWPGTTGVLTAGQTVTCTGTYKITEDDAKAGSFTNMATVTGKAPDGTIVTGQACATIKINLDLTPLLNVKKESDTAIASVGQVVNFTVTVENIGSREATGLYISDYNNGVRMRIPDSACTWPTATIGTLPVGTEMTCTYPYTTTQADADRGNVTNIVTVYGNYLSGPGESGTTSGEDTASLGVTDPKGSGSGSTPAPTATTPSNTTGNSFLDGMCTRLGGKIVGGSCVYGK